MVVSDSPEWDCPDSASTVIKVGAPAHRGGGPPGRIVGPVDRPAAPQQIVSTIREGAGLQTHPTGSVPVLPTQVDSSTVHARCRQYDADATEHPRVTQIEVIRASREEFEGEVVGRVGQVLVGIGDDAAVCDRNAAGVAEISEIEL